MTWPWRICSSLLVATSLGAGMVSGRVTLAGSRAPNVRKQRDYSGVVAWLEPAGRPAPPLPPRTATMTQRDKRFVPHVVAIGVGSTVEFPNFDPIFHNAFSNFSGQPFDTGLYPPGKSQKVTFRREGVVHVFCNIHSSMSAVIVVLKTPYFALSARDGSLNFSGVPPGEYRLKVWHERATEATLQALERRIVVGEGATELPHLKISESGHVEVPHKDKYGQEYSPEPPAYSPHPGAHP